MRVFVSALLLVAKLSAVEVVIPGGALDENDNTAGLFHLKALLPFYQDEELQEILTQENQDTSGLSQIEVGMDRVVVSLTERAAHRYEEAKLLPPTRLAFEKARYRLLKQLQMVHEIPPPLSLQSITYSQVLASDSQPLVSSEIRPILLPVLTDEDTVVDGKIWMKEPKWTETRKFGYIMGGLCFVITVGTIAAAILFSAFIALAGVPFLLSGLYLTWGSFLHDPEALASYRARDLVEGFRKAYRQKTARYTLTPLERRHLFLAETIVPMQKNPKSKDYPIFWVAHVYNLKDETMKPMFLSEEREILTEIKESFLQSYNLISKPNSNLEQELLLILAHHQEERDSKLDEVRAEYNRNPAVARYQKLKEDKEENLRQIARLYEKKKINEEEKDKMVAFFEERFSDAVAEEGLGPELAKATQELILKQEAILEDYEDKVLECKKILSFDEKMKDLESGLLALYEEHNKDLLDYVVLLPADHPAIEDFLDLREAFR